MSTSVYDGIIQNSTSLYFNTGNAINTTSSSNSGISNVVVFLSNNTIYNLNNNSSIKNISQKMENGSMEETNPRLVNGVVNLLLMLFNIGGNSLVLYVYHSLFADTVFNLFVKALASLDLLTAVTTMLIDVIMKMRANHEDELNTSAMCKLSHFQVYANSMASGCVLILIAYQRYKKICHPLERGMLLRHAKILLVVICLSCLVISIPTIILYGSRHVKTLVRSTVVDTTICRADQNYQDTPLNLIFYYLLMVAFCFVLGSTCVLYFMVSRSIRKFENRSSAIFNSSLPTTPTPEGYDTADEDVQYGVGDCRNSRQTTRTMVTTPVHGRNPINNINGARRMSPHSPTANNILIQTPTTRAKGGYAPPRRMSTFAIATSKNVISTQMYRVFSIITVVFIISYLPHLVALILTKVLSLDDKVLTQGQRMALEFAYNCPYISTVSNPIIYGFSSAEFRDRVRELLQSCDICCCYCCCCCCCDSCDDDYEESCFCSPFDRCKRCECCAED